MEEPWGAAEEADSESWLWRWLSLEREREEEEEDGKEKLGWKKTGGAFRREGREKRGREGRREPQAINGANHSPYRCLGWVKPIPSPSSLFCLDYITPTEDRNLKSILFRASSKSKNE